MWANSIQVAHHQRQDFREVLFILPRRLKITPNRRQPLRRHDGHRATDDGCEEPVQLGHIEDALVLIIRVIIIDTLEQKFIETFVFFVRQWGE